MFAIMKVI